MSEKVFELQRFYYGVFSGQSSVKPAVLARTPGVSTQQVSEGLLFGRLEPPRHISDEMPASMGLFRGKNVPFVLTIARINSQSTPQLQYILLDTAVLLRMGGNMQTFLGLAHNEMPLFDKLRELSVFRLNNLQPPDPEAQGESIQRLLLYCKDNMKAVEGLLTALIQGNNVAVINAPASLEQRVYFLEGLVMLLPRPARGILTFATYVNKPENSVAQIKFLVNANTRPADHTMYDWQSGSLFPAKYERHNYARFVVSQLRLDPDRAVAEAERLAQTASWRAIRKDHLSNALEWVARRAKIDRAVQAGQPADRAAVAAILREDPTLSDELRVAYSQHLLTFALALQEWQTAEMVPAIAAGHQEVASAALSHLREAAKKDQALEVYNLIEYWLNEVAAAQSLPWQQALHTAIFSHVQALLEARNLKQLVAFIYRLCNSAPILKIEQVAEKVVALMQPPARKVPQVAQALLVFGASYLSAGGFQDLISDIELVRQLPQPQQQAVVLLQPEMPEGVEPVPNVLAKAAKTVPAQYDTVVLVRFVEGALHLRRAQVIGELELRALLRLAETRRIERFQHIIKYLVDEFSASDRIKPLGAKGWILLPQLYFMTGSINEGIRLLEYYQNELFTLDRLAAFSDLIGEVFLRVKLPAEQMLDVLNGFEGSKIRTAPRARAYFASILNQGWAPKMEPVARQLTSMFYEDQRLIRLVGVDNTLRLLDFHANRKNLLDGLRVATALVQVALPMGEAGSALLVKAWQSLGWSPEVRNAALELLRRYIRLLPPEQSVNTPDYFAQRISPEVGEVLKVARMVRIISGDDDFLKLAEVIHFTRTLMFDLAVAYDESRAIPTEVRLRRDLDALAGNLTETERQQLAENIVEITRLIYTLGSPRRSPLRKTGLLSPRKTGRLSLPTTNKNVVRDARDVNTPPQTAVEFLTWLGMYFSDNIVMEVDLARGEAAHILGVRSVSMLYQEAQAIRDFLTRLAAAFPPGKKLPAVEIETLKAEIDNLWGELRLHDQRKTQSSLAEESQQAALLLQTLAQRGSDKILSDRGLGKQLETGRKLPQNELEALRWIGGYFARTHT